MKVLSLLLHDERFSGWSIKDKLARQHFSTEYLRFYRQKGADPILYTFHNEIRSVQTHELCDLGTVKVFPVKHRFPPFLRFGNDHNPKDIVDEMLQDQPDLVHFHNYYLHSFPYIAVFVKKRLKRPLIAQLHGYDHRSVCRWLYLSCLLALKNCDKILYSYSPEKALYRKLGVSEKTVRLPVPGIDPEIFKPRSHVRTKQLLYVGRIPAAETANGEKSPVLLIKILKKLLRRSMDVKLDIVGDGPGFDHCLHVAHDLGVADHIAFHGYVPYTELPDFYQTSTLTFSPMQIYDVDGWFDGAIQESLACGTPVAAFRTSSKTPLYGTYGVLLSQNVEKAAEEVHMILKAPEKAEALAMKGSDFVRRNCTRDKIASRLERTARSVISG